MELFNKVKEYTQLANKEWYVYLLAVCILCSVDVLSGVFNAFMKGEMNSKEFKKGAIGKSAILGIVALGMGLDYLFEIHYLYISTCIFYIVEEAVSIIENLGDYIKIPQFIKEKLKDLKNEGGKE